MINYKEKSLAELTVIQTEVNEVIEQKKKEERYKTIKEIQAKMTEYGIDMSDLEAKAKKPKGEYVAKYRKDGNEWSGKGKRPRWFKEAAENGDDMSQYLVNRSES